MKTLMFAAALSLITLVPATAMAGGDGILTFQGGIAVDPVSGITSGAPTPNIVRGVEPGGVPWVIQHLNATVDLSRGYITVQGRGLLLAGGQGIGTAPALDVFANLFCGAPTGTPVSFTSQPVALQPNGDFRINSDLSAEPPDPCDAPVLLIEGMVGGTGRWFAAAIPNIPNSSGQ